MGTGDDPEMEEISKKKRILTHMFKKTVDEEKHGQTTVQRR